MDKQPGKTSAHQLLISQKSIFPVSLVRSTTLVSDALLDLTRRKLTGLLLLVLTIIMVLFSLFTPAVEIYFNGEYIGDVQSYSEFSDVLALAESQISDILGREYHMNADYSYEGTVSLRGNLLSKSEIRSGLLSRADDIVNRYALVVDGEIIGSSDSPEKLAAIVEHLTLRETAVSATIAEPYSISYRMIPANTATEVAEILAAADDALTVLTVKESSYSVAIPYDTVIIFDEELYTGEYELVSEGQYGELLVSLDVYEADGEHIENIITGSSVVSEAVSAVYAMGLKARPITVSYGNFIWPVSGTFSSGFGARSSGVHNGIDICNELGTSICAADGGVVIRADAELDGFGNLVIVRHDDGTETYYAHLDAFLVTEGERVYQGQEIGRMGTTGRSSGVHLHFEVHVNGTEVDPLLYLPEL